MGERLMHAHWHGDGAPEGAIALWARKGNIACWANPLLGFGVGEIERDHAYPRPAALAVAQVLMAIGHFLFAMGWPGTMYTATLLIGLGYGAHWAIVPAAISELFGLRNFGALYNFLTLSSPAGSVIFSGIIASGIYDNEAQKQAGLDSNWASSTLSRVVDGGKEAIIEEPLRCEGAICFYLSSLIMAGLCVLAVSLSITLVHRTKTVYANLYGGYRQQLQ